MTESTSAGVRAALDVRAHGDAALAQPAHERESWDRYYASLPEEAEARVDSPPAFDDELVRAVRALLPEGGRVLEAGCGAGGQSLALARAGGFEVHLLDSSREALRRARLAFERAGLAAECIEADAFAPGAPEYDLVFNSGVLEHYTPAEQAALLRAMARRSRRYVMALVPNRLCYWYWLWRVHACAEGRWPWGKEVAVCDLAEPFARAGMRVGGVAFLGERWSESFIDGLHGIDAELRRQLIAIHRQPHVPRAQKAYLVAALGLVDERAPIPPMWRASAHGEEVGVAELASALADATSATLAAERRCAEAGERLAAREHEAASERVDHERERARAADELARAHAERTRIEGEQQRLRDLHEQLARELELARSTSASAAAQAREALLRARRELALLRDSRSHRFGQWVHELRARPGRALSSALARPFRSRGTSGVRRADPLLAADAFLGRAHDALAAGPTGPAETAEPPAAPMDSPTPSQAGRAWMRRAWSAVAQRPAGHAIKRVLPAALRARIRGSLEEHGRGAAAEALREADYWRTLASMRERAARPAERLRARHAAALAEVRRRLQSARGLVVHLPTINWTHLFQRPQQLMRQLTRKGYVCLFCSAVPEDDRVDGLKEVERDLFLCSDPRLAMGFANPLLWIHWPILRAYVEFFPGARVVYEQIDELAVFRLRCRHLRADHHALLESADVVAATSRLLLAGMRARRPDALLVPNAVEAADFGSAAEGEPPRDLLPALRRGRPIVGYYGALASWFDYELVNELTARAPDLGFVLIGSDVDGSSKALERRDNLFVLGRKPYSELARYARRFDVATIPFRVDPVTRAVSPVKLFEYMAAGAPVVTTALDECLQYEPVRAARGADEFLALLRSSVGLRSDPAHQRRLARVVAANGWEQRAAAILAALDARPRAQRSAAGGLARG